MSDKRKNWILAIAITVAFITSSAFAEDPILKHEVLDTRYTNTKVKIIVEQGAPAFMSVSEEVTINKMMIFFSDKYGIHRNSFMFTNDPVLSFQLQDLDEFIESLQQARKLLVGEKL
jgi:hypothetical protein